MRVLDYFCYFDKVKINSLFLGSSLGICRLGVRYEDLINDGVGDIRTNEFIPMDFGVIRVFRIKDCFY